MKQILSLILCIWLIFSSVASDGIRHEVKPKDDLLTNIFSTKVLSDEENPQAEEYVDNECEQQLQSEAEYDYSEEPYEAAIAEEENAVEAATSPYEGVFDSVETYCKHAFVYDMTAEKAYYRGGFEERIYPASITKLWTAYIALKILEPEAVITAGDELDFVKHDSSVALIEKDNKLTVETLVEAMLLPSGNDAAYIIARAAGEKLIGENSEPSACIEAFVEAMNDSARENGMLKTRFMNPGGYHNDNHYTTMQDLLLMAKTVIECETILKYTGLSGDGVYFESGEYREWHNTNLLIDKSSPFYIEGVFGLKTGYTSLAGHCLLAAYKSDESYIIVGVFGCDTFERRFEDAYKIITYKT